MCDHIEAVDRDIQNFGALLAWYYYNGFDAREIKIHPAVERHPDLAESCLCCLMKGEVKRIQKLVNEREQWR